MNKTNKVLLASTVILGGILLAIIIQSVITGQRRDTLAKEAQTAVMNSKKQGPQALLSTLKSYQGQFKAMGKPIMNIGLSNASADDRDDFCGALLESINNAYNDAALYLGELADGEYSDQDIEDLAQSITSTSMNAFIAAGCDL